MVTACRFLFVERNVKKSEYRVNVHTECRQSVGTGVAVFTACRVLLRGLSKSPNIGYCSH